MKKHTQEQHTAAERRAADKARTLKKQAGRATKQLERAQASTAQHHNEQERGGIA